MSAPQSTQQQPGPLAWIAQRWFLVALLALIGSGMAFSPALTQFAEAIPRRLIVATVLFLMALPMELHSIRQAFGSPGPVLLAIGLNVCVVPLLAWPVSWLLPSGLSEGMIIASVIPCTLASAAVWTRKAGGNDAVALLVTMSTNLACFIVAPAWIWLLLSAHVELDAAEMIQRLFLLVVLPILLAQAMRSARPIAHWASSQKVALSVVAQFGILSMVFIGAVNSGEQLRSLDGATVSIVHWTILIVGVVGVHMAVLFLGKFAAKQFGFTREDSIAVAFAGSQKTLMVGLDLTIQYAPLFGGLAILPMVAYHLGQLVVDTVLADRWRKT